MGNVIKKVRPQVKEKKKEKMKKKRPEDIGKVINKYLP